MFEPLHDASAHDHREPAAKWVLVQNRQILVADSLHGRDIPPGSAVSDLVEPLSADQIHLLGRLDETLWWTAALSDDAVVPHGFQLADLRSLMAELDAQAWNMAGRATQIIDWARDHRFCGRCGGATERAAGDRSLKCPDDGYAAYPRLSPAVIVLITNDDGHALLGRSGAWTVPMYSTLAGFVEPGETLEETVIREVREEVGIEVGHVRYFASQAWPFPNSLMLGFTAKWKSGDIVVDGVEIVDAQWFSPDNLPMIPPRQSIARRLIDSWLAS